MEFLIEHRVNLVILFDRVLKIAPWVTAFATQVGIIIKYLE